MEDELRNLNLNNRPSGKPNHQARREEARRQKLGKRFMEENDKRINERTYQHLLEAFQEKQRVRESGDQTAVPVPVTTRGIGLNITAQFQYLEARHNKSIRYSDLDRLALYRVSLIQADKQLFESENQHPGRDFDPLIHSLYQRTEFTELFNNISVKDNLGLVGNSISSLGTFEYNQTIFRTKIPALQRVQKVVPMPMEASDAGPAAQRPAVAVLRTVPDPYLVTIRNLRDTVVALADAETPLVERERFYRLDPIPGSEWRDGRLVNGDAIMPADYNVRHFQNDQMRVANFLANIKRYDKCYLTPLALDGSGSRTVLTTTHQSATTTVNWREFSTHAYADLSTFDEITVRCLYPLPSTDTLYAALALMSEWPVDWEQNHAGTHLWSLRYANLSSYGYRENWATLVGNILNTIPKPVSGPGAV